MAALSLVALFGLTGSAMAASLDSTFEIEGNAIDEAWSGDDWDSLYYYWMNSLFLHSLNPDLDVYSGVIVDFGDNDTTMVQEINSTAHSTVNPKYSNSNRLYSSEESKGTFRLLSPLVTVRRSSERLMRPVGVAMVQIERCVK